jgi:hypothetical protein
VNPGSLWKIINRAIPSKEKVIQTYNKDLKTVADDFNYYFTSVSKNAADASSKLTEENNFKFFEHPLTSIPYPPDGLFNFRLVTVEDVRRIIISLPSNKSPGPDKVHTKVLKDCLSVILGPLTEIINCCLHTSTFSDSWKEAEAIPLLKEGDHEVP